MRIDVRYFASTREASGREAESLDLVPGATVATLKADLATRHPHLASQVGRLRFAVGERFADDDTTLQDGDVVALIPPVSGG